MTGGTLALAGALTKSGVTVSTVNAKVDLAHTGGSLSVVSGLLRLGGGGSWSGAAVVSGGTLDLHAGVFLVDSGASLAGGGAVTITGADVNVSVAIGLTGSLATSAGSLVLASVPQPSLLASVSVTGGALVVRAATAFSSLSGVSGGSLLLAADVSVSGGVCQIVDASVNIVVGVALSTSTSCAVSGSSTVAGDGSVRVVDGTLTLAAPNLVVGPSMTIAGGNVSIMAATSFAKGVAVASGAGLQIVSPSQFDGGLQASSSATVVVSAPSSVGGGSCAFGASVTIAAGRTLTTLVDCNVSGIVSGAGSWVHSPVGQLVLRVIGADFGAALTLSGAAVATTSGDVIFRGPVNVQSGALLSTSLGSCVFVSGLNSEGSVSVATVTQIAGGTCSFAAGSLTISSALTTAVACATTASVAVSGLGLLNVSAATFTFGVADGVIGPFVNVAAGATAVVTVSTVFSSLVTVAGLLQSAAACTLSGGLSQTGSVDVQAETLSVAGAQYALTGGQLLGDGSLSCSAALVLVGPAVIRVLEVILFVLVQLGCSAELCAVENRSDGDLERGQYHV